MLREMLAGLKRNALLETVVADLFRLRVSFAVLYFSGKLTAPRHLISRSTLRTLRSQAHAAWNAAVVA
jgi:hypothetical protein